MLRFMSHNREVKTRIDPTVRRMLDTHTDIDALKPECPDGIDPASWENECQNLLVLALKTAAHEIDSQYLLSLDPFLREFFHNIYSLLNPYYIDSLIKDVTGVTLPLIMDAYDYISHALLNSLDAAHRNAVTSPRKLASFYEPIRMRCLRGSYRDLHRVGLAWKLKAVNRILHCDGCHQNIKLSQFSIQQLEFLMKLLDKTQKKTQEEADILDDRVMLFHWSSNAISNCLEVYDSQCNALAMRIKKYLTELHEVRDDYGYALLTHAKTIRASLLRSLSRDELIDALALPITIDDEAIMVLIERSLETTSLDDELLKHALNFSQATIQYMLIPKLIKASRHRIVPLLAISFIHEQILYSIRGGNLITLVENIESHDVATFLVELLRLNNADVLMPRLQEVYIFLYGTRFSQRKNLLLRKDVNRQVEQLVTSQEELNQLVELLPSCHQRDILDVFEQKSLPNINPILVHVDVDYLEENFSSYTDEMILDEFVKDEAGLVFTCASDFSGLSCVNILFSRIPCEHWSRLFALKQVSEHIRLLLDQDACMNIYMELPAEKRLHFLSLPFVRKYLNENYYPPIYKMLGKLKKDDMEVFLNFPEISQQLNEMLYFKKSLIQMLSGIGHPLARELFLSTQFMQDKLARLIHRPFDLSLILLNIPPSARWSLLAENHDIQRHYQNFIIHDQPNCIFERLIVSDATQAQLRTVLKLTEDAYQEKERQERSFHFFAPRPVENDKTFLTVISQGLNALSDRRMRRE